MRLIMLLALGTAGTAGIAGIAGIAAATHYVPPSASLQAVARDTLRFVAHPEHMQAGKVVPRDTLHVRNPFEGSGDAVATGAKLYVAYNCVDCHGADGSGAMAPAFSDGRWHFGGSASEVYESIFQGRPDGMPAWGGLIDDASIWRLVAYVRSLQNGKDVSTENFTGSLVQRTGH